MHVHAGIVCGSMAICEGLHVSVTCCVKGENFKARLHVTSYKVIAVWFC
jgi:hypothetical protein